MPDPIEEPTGDPAELTEPLDSEPDEQPSYPDPGGQTSS